MGVFADIYKAGGRSHANGGISDRCDRVTVVNVPGPFIPSDEAPAVMLVAGNIAGTLKVVPAGGPPGQKWRPIKPSGARGPMMGGCYVFSSDAAFFNAAAEIAGEAVAFVPVALHDRFETAGQSAALSA